jgi:hypothetical protein
MISPILVRESGAQLGTPATGVQGVYDRCSPFAVHVVSSAADQHAPAIAHSDSNPYLLNNGINQDTFFPAPTGAAYFFFGRYGFQDCG